MGYRLASFLSSRADVAADLQLLPNTMVMERAGIQPFVRIGKNSIIWSTTRIGFRTIIGDHCWLVSSLLGESVHVGDYSFVGLGATLAPNVRIGQANIIGAGAVTTLNKPTPLRPAQAAALTIVRGMAKVTSAATTYSPILVPIRFNGDRSSPWPTASSSPPSKANRMIGIHPL